MRKYLIGSLFGILLTFSISVHAEEIQSLIGRAIEGQFIVKLDGKQLEKQAIVVDGTSYLPVRAIGEALNMDVGFDADLGITLKSKIQQTPPKEVTQTVTTQQQTLQKIPITPFDYRNYRQDTSNPELNKVNGELEYRYTVLNTLQRGYNGELDNLAKSTPENRGFSEERIAKYNVSIPEQEAKIAELEAKKAALEAGQ